MIPKKQRSSSPHQRTENGRYALWTDLPFVHRFDIIESEGKHYLIACCLKSGHEYKDDWSSPGKVYAALLPEDLSSFDDKHQLKLEVIKDDMLKNHGYYRVVRDGKMSSIVCCDGGVFRFYPPTSANPEWTIETLLETPLQAMPLSSTLTETEKMNCWYYLHSTVTLF
ncbi:MAG: hypothetical protein ACLVHS_17340 [Blautia wexlerae]